MTDLKLQKIIDCNQGAVRAVRYNVDGSYCLSCGSDKKIKLWNPLNGLLLKTYGGHADEVTDAVGSCDSCHIVSASLDKSIIYWDVTTGQTVRRLRVHAGGVNCVRFNEDSSIAVSGSKDHSIMCWDIRTRKLEPIQVMKDAKDCITSLIVTNHKIIASSLDGAIRHYDIRAGELTCDKVGEPVTYIAQTSDEQCIVAACLDGVVRLIDNDSGDILSEYKGHKAEDYHIECGILANDSQIVSGSMDGGAIIWDLIDAKQIFKLEVGNAYGMTIAFHLYFDFTGQGVVHSLATHPTGPSIILAKRRDLYIFSPMSSEPIE